MAEPLNVVSLATVRRMAGKKNPPKETPALSSLLSQAPRPVIFGQRALPRTLQAVADTDTGHAISVEALWGELLSGPRRRTKPPPRKVCVHGVFFGGHLLYPGWWTRGKATKLLRSGDWNKAEAEVGVADIRRWLNTGYELWGPSWDIFNPRNEKQVLFGQLGYDHGDEVESLHVIVAPNAASDLRNAMGSQLATGVTARGTLYHDSHLQSGMAEGTTRALGMAVEHGSERMGFFLVIHDIEPDGRETADFIDVNLNGEEGPSRNMRRPPLPRIYSAYMWQCLIHERDVEDGLKGEVALPRVIFTWEHTNLLSKDCIAFNHASLLSKKTYLEGKLNGGKLHILQQSFSVEGVLGSEFEKPLVNPGLLATMLGHAHESASSGALLEFKRCKASG